VNGSRSWHLFFRIGYRFLRVIDPLIRLAWRAGFTGLARIADLETVGRRSGRPRRTLLTVLTFDGRRYVGHPDGPTAWTRNLEAGGPVAVRYRLGATVPIRALRLEAGPERDGVIRATWSQQPFPSNVVYWSAREHVQAVGVYYRLEDREPPPTARSDLNPGTQTGSA
jgi:deazaflavin-dependent oxidoreductase (nitroreductase family)